MCRPVLPNWFLFIVSSFLSVNWSHNTRHWRKLNDNGRKASWLCGKEVTSYRCIKTNFLICVLLNWELCSGKKLLTCTIICSERLTQNHELLASQQLNLNKIPMNNPSAEAMVWTNLFLKLPSLQSQGETRRQDTRNDSPSLLLL